MKPKRCKAAGDNAGRFESSVINIDKYPRLRRMSLARILHRCHSTYALE
jgi:hypothetical protein